MALASTLVRVVADGGIFLLAVTGVHGRIPVGDKPVGQRGVEFALRLLPPGAHFLDGHFFGQTREACRYLQLARSTLHYRGRGTSLPMRRCAVGR
jgi:hypothetical protein